MCARHHAKWKRMVDFAKTKEEREKYLQRAMFWLKMQTEFVSLWAMEQKANSDEMKKKLIEVKANLLLKLTNYGKIMVNEFEIREGVA